MAAGLLSRLATACFFALLGLAAAATAEEPMPKTKDASQVVDRLHESLTEAMGRAEELGFEGRYQILAPAIREAYDLPLMARRSVGRHFRKLDDEQRGKLIDSFTRLTIATYADRLREGSDSHFEIRSEEPGDHGTVLVKAVALALDGEETALTYRLRLVEDQFRIIDIFLKGTISELALRRSEYTSLIEREGFQGLMDTLEAKISEHRTGNAGTSGD